MKDRLSLATRQLLEKLAAGVELSRYKMGMGWRLSDDTRPNGAVVMRAQRHGLIEHERDQDSREFYRITKEGRAQL